MTFEETTRTVAKPSTQVPAAALEEWVTRLLENVGVAPEPAMVTAQSLVDADLRGIGTHGVVRVPIYVKRLQLGLINPAPQAGFLSVGIAAERLDGDNGLGQWVGLKAILRACELARQGGVGMVLATHSNHFGTAGWFARRAAEEGCAGIIFSQAESMVVPFGGTQRFFGTNPFCLSMPRYGAEPITLDMATSAVPYGKIETARVTSGVIPSDWAVDAEGRPTTDPCKVHALQPMAGPKGSGMAMLADLLSGGLAGEACGPRIRRMYDDFEHEHDLVHTFIAIDAGAFAAKDAAERTTTEMVADLRVQRPAEGFDEVLLPGEVEERNAQKNRQAGLWLPPCLVEILRALGEEHATEFPV